MCAVGDIRHNRPGPVRCGSVALARAIAEIRRQKRLAQLARPAALIAQQVIGHVAQTFGGVMPRPRRAPW